MTRPDIAARLSALLSVALFISACHPALPEVVHASSRFMTNTTNAVPVRLDIPVANVISLDAEPGTYVVVARVTNRLQVDVLYPHSPLNQRPYTGGADERTIRFLPGSSESGGIYAIASDKPFDFSGITNGSRWPSRITKYQSMSEAVVIPKYAQKLDVVAGRFFDDIAPAAAKLGFDGQLYGESGPLHASRVPVIHDCRKAESRDPCPVH